ncbi:hypothetical protein BTM25_08570 [Actinomadura rubteroloni]|uniref:HEAT repeat domain-containing protein n=1 Tax=Actinomadura rubteroloni TaxID=1926885 RepID=A0A2P4UN25_9ACTN|nr:hypothetical protein BTM25_08570 [Actinomadura rubteroloni]
MNAWADALRELDDPESARRAKAAVRLRDATGHAADVIPPLLARFDAEPDPGVADLLGETLGALAPHDPQRRLDVTIWLRSGHVREAARADHALDGDRDGRLALARSLLHHADAEHRLGGLLVAARVMSRWRSAVPELLPAVAGFADDPSAEHRILALRILDMCGPAARPWADLAAAHLTADREPDGVARRYALMALSRMGDERAVPPLADLLAAGHDGFLIDLPDGERGREANEPNIAEALAPFAAHTAVLLDPLLARVRATPPTERAGYYKIINRWQDDGADVAARILRLLDDDDPLAAVEDLIWVRTGTLAPRHKERLEERLRLPEHVKDGTLLDPFDFLRITGDAAPLRRMIGPSDWSGFPRQRSEVKARNMINACIALGPALADRFADSARDAFRAALRGETRPPFTEPADPVWLARALWKLTGNQGEIIDPLTRLAEKSGHRDFDPEPLLLIAAAWGKGRPMHGYYTGQLSRGASTCIRKGNHRDALRFLQALWDNIGTPYYDDLTLLMAGLLRICPPASSRPPNILAALELLAGIAAADPRAIAPAYPFLQAATDADERPRTRWYFCPPRTPQWRAVLDDDALRAAAGTIPRPLTDKEWRRIHRICFVSFFDVRGERMEGPEKLLELWDPDRVRHFLYDVERITVEEMRRECGGSLVYFRPRTAAVLLPFLVEAALDPAAPARSSVLQTIEYIVMMAHRSEKQGNHVTRPMEPDADWDDAFDNAMTDLIPLLDDDAHADDAVTILSYAVHRTSADRADGLLRRLLARDPVLGAVSKDDLVRVIGELAANAEVWREDAVDWLRELVERTPDPEPDFVMDREAWNAWCDRNYARKKPDSVPLTLPTVTALRKTLPELADPH